MIYRKSSPCEAFWGENRDLFSFLLDISSGTDGGFKTTHQIKMTKSNKYLQVDFGLYVTAERLNDHRNHL